MGPGGRRRASASGSASTSRPCTPTTGSCCACRTSRPTTAAPPTSPTSCSSTRTSVEDARDDRARRLGAVRGPVPRVRGAGAAAAPAHPGKRQPLWQQRQRAAQLLQVASQYGSFPIVLETVRECLQDVFDVPGLVALMRERAVARRPAGRGRDPAAVAVRAEPALRLRRRSSSTRATRRWPNAAPPRSHWTRRCSPSCSAAARGVAARPARPRRAHPDARRSCSACRPSGDCAARRASPTCCGSSDR